MALKDFYSNAFADNIRIAKSRTLGVLAAGDYGLIRVPPKSLIMAVWVLVLTAYDGTTPTATIGWSDVDAFDSDAFMDSTATAIPTAGMKGAGIDSQPVSEGTYRLKGGAITLTMAQTDTTAGSMIVFAEYSIIY